MTVFLSEVTSNTAQVATMTPVLAAMAPALGLDPKMLVVVCAIAASSAYMMPVGTPPNAIVFGTGLIRMPQMVRAGFVLNLAGIVVITALGWWLDSSAPADRRGARDCTKVQQGRSEGAHALKSPSRSRLALDQSPTKRASPVAHCAGSRKRRGARRKICLIDRDSAIARERNNVMSTVAPGPVARPRCSPKRPPTTTSRGGRCFPSPSPSCSRILPAPAGLPQHAWYFFAIFAGVIVGLMVEPLPGGAIGLIGVTLVAVLAPYVLFSPAELAKPGFKSGERRAQLGALGLLQRHRVAHLRRLHVRAGLREDGPGPAHRAAAGQGDGQAHPHAGLRRHDRRHDPRALHAVQHGAGAAARSTR